MTLLQLAMPSGRPLGGQTLRTETIALGYLRQAEATTVLSPPADPEVTRSGGRLSVRTPGGHVSLRWDPDLGFADRVPVRPGLRVPVEASSSRGRAPQCRSE